MKGIKLFDLIKSLNRSEKQSLCYQLGLSEDKKAIILLDLITLKVKTLEELNRFLRKEFNLNSYTKSNDDVDKKARQFIVFATEKIENIKILNHLNKNKKERFRLLSKIYKDENEDLLFRKYVKKLEVTTQNSDNSQIRNELLSWKINLFGTQQMEKNLKVISNLLLEKKQQIQLNKHQQLSELYRIASNLFFDDIRISEIKPSDTDLDTLSAESDNQFYAADYLITKARFAFFSSNFKVKIDEAEGFVKKAEISTHQKNILLRRCLFIKMIAGFQYNEPLENMLKFATEVKNYNLNYGFRDSFSFFYHLLFLVLSNKIEETQLNIIKNKDLFISQETYFYIEFIEAFILLRENNLNKKNKALKAFSALRYSPNYYISLWSAFFEFAIHYKNGNYILCKSLIERIKMQLQKNKQRQFIYKDSLEIYRFYRSLIFKNKPFEHRKNINILYRFLINYITQD